MTAFPDAPFGEADRIDLDGAPLAVIRYSGLRLDDLRTVFDTAYSALGRAVGAGTVVPSGPALAVYHGDPGELFDLEVGFPVAEALGGPVVADDTTIVPSTLPTGPAFATSFFGAYDGLGQAWGSLLTRVAEQDAEPLDVMIEVYVTDPSDAPPGRLRTDLIVPARVP